METNHAFMELKVASDFIQETKESDTISLNMVDTIIFCQA